MEISSLVNLKFNSETSEVTLDGKPLSLKENQLDLVREVLVAQLSPSAQLTLKEALGKTRKSAKTEIGDEVMPHSNQAHHARAWWAKQKNSGVCMRKECETQTVAGKSFCRRHLNLIVAKRAKTRAANQA
jgi:hypothetical protein